MPINKQKITYKVYKRLNKTIHHTHITNIISLFADEFLKELKNGKNLEISNFCTFKLEKSTPRKYFDVQMRKISYSKGQNILKAKLSKELRKEIVKHLDLLKTFL